MAVEELGLEIAVKGFAGFISNMKEADKATGKLASGWTEGGKRIAAGFKDAMDAIRPLGVALSAMAAVGAVAIRSAVKEAKEFESQAVLMAIASGETGDAFERLSSAAIKVGGDTRLVGVSASGAAKSITELYKAGFTTAEIFGDLNSYMDKNAQLGGILRASIDLAAASELDMAQGAEVLAIAMKTFGISTDDASYIANNFVQTADASVASVSELAAAMVNVGSTAAAFGWRLEDVNVALALLSERGIKGSEAGTALKSMMTNLMRPTDAVKETLRDLNIELYDEHGAMKSLRVILGDLSGAMAGLTEEQRNQAVQTLAGSYGMKAMNTLLEEGTDGWWEMTAAISHASTAQEIAAQQAETLAGKIEAFEGALEAAKITLGRHFIPAITKAISAGSDLLEGFNKLSPAAQKTTATLLGVGTALAGAAGGFILMAPRIVTTVKALKTMIPLVKDTGVAFQLLASGEKAADVASLGLSGTLAAVILPLAALTAVVLAGNAALEGHHEKTIALSDSYERYIDMMQKTGRASQALSEQEWEASRAIEVVNEKIGITPELMEHATTLTDGWAAAMRGATTSVDETSGAVSNLDAQLGILNESLAGPVGEENDKYAEAQEVIWGKINETKQALIEAQTEFGIASEEAGVHREKLEDLRGELGDLSAAHRDAMNKIVYDLMMARLATDGWTQAEADLALEVAKDMGLIDEETWEAATQMNAALEAFAGGAGQAETKATISEISGQLAAIPRTINVTIKVRKELATGVTERGEGMGGVAYQHGTPFVPHTGPAILHRGEAVLPAGAAAVYRQSIVNNSPTNHYNLTTQSTTRPGGLAMEFGAMAFAGAGASR